MKNNDFKKGDKVICVSEDENQKGEILATYEDKAWVALNGFPLTYQISYLKKVGNFERLRNLPIDTKVLVWGWGSENKKIKRHFAKVSECGKLVWCFSVGTTSFTSSGDDDITAWENCEIVE